MCPNDRNAVGWGAGGEGRAGPTLQDIKPSHLGRAALRRREGGAAGTLGCVPCRPWPRRLREAASCTLRGNRTRQHCGVATKKTHFRSTRLQRRLLSKASRVETNQEIETPESQIGARPLPRNLYVAWPWGRTPLPPRVFDLFSASAVNSVWIGPFFDQKDPPTVRCAWEAVRSLFTLKNAASHPPTLTGYIIWG